MAKEERCDSDKLYSIVIYRFVQNISNVYAVLLEKQGSIYNLSYSWTVKVTTWYTLVLRTSRFSE